ncbi:MAG: cbb3-type cytochrome c oxidase subunit I [Thermodesulfobacteriota bacterium]
MSKITVAFIRAAIVYFVLAMLLGIRMSWTGATYPSMPMHVHFNLLGWMSMMIYGVAYHILPRFSGRPLWSEKLSTWHFWLANIGLIGMVIGWILIGSSGGGGYLLYISSLIEGVSIIFFAVNMAKTVKAAPPAPPRPPARPKPPKPPVKTTPAAEGAKKAETAPKPVVKTAEAAPSSTKAKTKKKARPAAKKVKAEDKRASDTEKVTPPAAPPAAVREKAPLKEGGTEAEAPEVKPAAPVEREPADTGTGAQEPSSPEAVKSEES